MKLEFRVMISPDRAFYSNIRLAALSLRHLGPPYDTARLRVSVGGHADLKTVQAANPWSSSFPVDWCVVPHEQFRQHSHLATHNRRFETSDADVVVICDCDVCVIDRIDEIITYLAGDGKRTVAGLPAHFSPYHFDAAGNEAAWRQVFAAAGLGEPPLSMRYSCDSNDVMGRAPPYFNYGFVLFGREAFAAVAPTNEYYCRLASDATNDSYFKAQIGLSLMIVAAKLDVKLLPHADNCPNDDDPFNAPEPFRLHSADDIRVIHYLRNAQADRRTFLTDPAAYEAFMAAPGLNRVNARLRDHLRGLALHDDLLFR